MLTRQSCGFYRVRRGARAVAAHEFKHSREMFPEDARVDMGEARDPRLSVASKGNSALDVAHRPQREREVEHRRHAGILSEAKGEIVVTPGLKQRDSAFQMAARFAVLSGEPMREPSCAVSDASLSRIGSCLDVAEEGRGVLLIDGNSPRT